MRIVKEELTGCVNRTAAGAPAFRYWVIETPINESGICKEFKSEEEDCFLQEEKNTHAISMEDFKEDTELAKEEILNLLTEKVGKCAAKDKLNIFTASVYDQGYIDGLRMGAQVMRLLNGDADTIKVTE
jgi:hypothetical protein